MRTESFILGTEEEIEVGKEYYFGQLWDGNHDGEELLKSGTISPDEEHVVEFTIVEEAEESLYAIVKVTAIR